MSNTESKPKRKKVIFPLGDFRGENRGLFTWSEIIDDEILDVSREILGAGTVLKEKLGTTLGTVLVGTKVSHHAQELIEYGADKVIIVEHPLLGEFVTRGYAEAIGGEGGVSQFDQIANWFEVRV